MNSNMNTPAELIEANINAGVTKAHLPLGKMILLGMMAGAFIALGAPAVMWQYILLQMWDWQEHWQAVFSRSDS